MDLQELYTPAILLDLNVMERNLKRYAGEAAKYGKQLWPMVKTHKSTELARLQQQYGCTGFLCGTLEEAEALCDAGFQNIMYAYPVAAGASVTKVVRLARKCPGFVIRIDGLESARAINEGAARASVAVNYTIIVDSGLHRFGLPPERAAGFADELKDFQYLRFQGISTHPGHVYGASGHDQLFHYCRDETRSIAIAASALRSAGYRLNIISSGSTPTFHGAVSDDNIRIYHPGNYIFNDAIQLSNGTALQEDCALTVLASVISHPSEELFICDAGAKCLGLDLGAHGNSSIKGHGVILGHPELTLYSLSEEVGKLHVDGETNLKVGDHIRIIPNHACSAANLTSYYIGVRQRQVERTIRVDIRGNSDPKIPE